MRSLIYRLVAPVFALMTFGCASPRSLPKYEAPIARAQFQSVRTTAYTHTEGDHRKYARMTACGTTLQCGRINSAACDWSRWPMGTVFRILETGECYQVDDYGWALAGTNTIDLYKPSRAAMNNWGTCRVNVEILRWGNVDQSLAILRARSGYAHVRRMLDEIKERYAEISQPVSVAALGADTHEVRHAITIHTQDQATFRPALTPFQ